MAVVTTAQQQLALQQQQQQQQQHLANAKQAIGGGGSSNTSNVNNGNSTNNGSKNCINSQPSSASSAASADESEEINTKELAQRISAELKRYSIPQAIFAQRVLCRSQGTLSDLLRNPKPWSKLKSGRETFRRMFKWLEEPEFQRMSALRLAGQSTVSSTVQSPHQYTAVNGHFSSTPTNAPSGLSRARVHLHQHEQHVALLPSCCVLSLSDSVSPDKSAPVVSALVPASSALFVRTATFVAAYMHFCRLSEDHCYVLRSLSPRRFRLGCCCLAHACFYHLFIFFTFVCHFAVFIYATQRKCHASVHLFLRYRFCCFTLRFLRFTRNKAFLFSALII